MCFPKPMFAHKIKMTYHTFINLISTDCPKYRANPLLFVVTQGGMAESLGTVQGYIFFAIDLDFAALCFQLASSLLVFWFFYNNMFIIKLKKIFNNLFNTQFSAKWFPQNRKSQIGNCYTWPVRKVSDLFPKTYELS